MAWIIFEFVALLLLWVIAYPVLLVVYTPFALVISLAGPGRYFSRVARRMRNFHLWYRKLEQQGYTWKS